MNILQDIKTAAKVFGEVRKARKNGATGVKIEPVRTIPVYTLAPALLNTMEGPLVWNAGRDVYQVVQEIFNGLPYETRRQLEFTPKKPGEWVERAQFWKRELQPAMPPQMYHEVMVLFISWYARCLRRRINKAQEMAV